MCPELPFQLFLSSLFYWGFAFPFGSLSLVSKFFFLHFLWCRSVGDEHFWPLYLFLKCSYFTFILSDFFFPLGIILSAEFFWFVDFSFYLWLSFMLHISGHFCLVVRHCKFVGYCIFLSSCQCFWDFSGSQLSYSVKFDSSGMCFLSFGGGSRTGLNLGLVSLCYWSKPICILNLVPHELWGLLVWLMEGGWLQNLCKGWLLSPLIISGGSVPCWRQFSHVHMLISSRLSVWKGSSLVL